MSTSTRTTIPSPRPAEDDTVVLEPVEPQTTAEHPQLPEPRYPWPEPWGSSPGRTAAVGVLGRGDGELALARPEPAGLVPLSRRGVRAAG